ncbi:ECs_2282 family putative zinc-binding protein [Pedobacter gandavensis]|uniref:ECs_2282 family putative zinc-binding protein n=1 Tax=Pedobacter gandavensis TaxID=2679963 RepID=UPI002930207D|nr:hypothetical protein [Pedobacter gandavensis]
MKKDYSIKLQLRCITCGGEQFDYNEDKTYVKCMTCNREYLNGYDELVELNQDNIDKGIEQIKDEVATDLKEDFTKKLKDAFRGSKNIKFK